MTELAKLLKPLDLPDWRKLHLTIHNVRWLARNMGFRNSNHPNFDRAQELVALIIRDNLIK